MKKIIMAAVAAGLIVCLHSTHGAGTWTVTQLTNDSVEDYGPRTSDGRVVWYANGNIFLSDGTTTQQLTTDGNNALPAISGPNVAWQHRDGSDNEIMMYDGTTTVPLTANTVPDERPEVSGNTVIWQRPVDSRYQIMYWDGSAERQVSSGGYCFFYRLDGTSCVWREAIPGQHDDIYMYDGTSTIQITNTVDLNEDYPDISGDSLAWHLVEGAGDYEVCARIGGTTVQVTDNTVMDSYPRISGTNVVWSGDDGTGNYEIFLWNGTTTVAITDTPGNEYQPVICGPLIAWIANDGGDADVFAYDGASIVQLTNDDVDDTGLEVSGTTLVWRKYQTEFPPDPGLPGEIMMAVYWVPEPATILLLGLAPLAALLRR